MGIEWATTAIQHSGPPTSYAYFGYCQNRVDCCSRRMPYAPTLPYLHLLSCPVGATRAAYSSTLRRHNLIRLVQKTYQTQHRPKTSQETTPGCVSIVDSPHQKLGPSGVRSRSKNRSMGVLAQQGFQDCQLVLSESLGVSSRAQPPGFSHVSPYPTY